MPPRTCIVLNLINRIFFLLKLNFSSLLKFLAFGFWRLPEIPWLIEGNVERMAFLGCSVGVSLQCRELTAVSRYPENDRLDHPRQWMCDSPRILYAVKEKKKKCKWFSHLIHRTDEIWNECSLSGWNFHIMYNLGDWDLFK